MDGGCSLQRFTVIDCLRAINTLKTGNLSMDSGNTDRVTAAYDLKTIISAEKKPRVLAVDDQRDALRLLQIRLQN